jgi:hypothetical protein
MKLETAWFGFRDQTMSNYFHMAKSLGLDYIEIPLIWHIIEDHYFRFSLDGIEQMKDLAQ